MSSRLLLVLAALIGTLLAAVPAAGQPTEGTGGPTAEQVAKLTATDADIADSFGWSVAVDGDTALIGSSNNRDDGNASGSAYVFTRGESGWAQQAKLTATDAAAYDYFGASVAIDGDTAVIGAPGDDDDAGDYSGSAYVFTRGESGWVEQAKLTATDAAAYDYFGWSVAIDGDTAVIGAYGDDDAGDYSGAAYVFTRTEGGWAEQAKLTATDGAFGDTFGWSVAVDGDTAVIGAYGDDDAGDYSGAAYVFTRTEGEWTQQAKLTATDAAFDDFFGHSVAVDSDTAVIGAPFDDDAGNMTGSAYLFTRTESGWAEQAKLTATDADRYDYFGSSVAIDGDTAVIGAYGDDDAGNWSGAAYLFTRGESGWVEQAKLAATDADGDDTFGWSVAVDGDTAVIGAPWDGDHASGSGSAYVFDLGTNTPPIAGDDMFSLLDLAVSIDPLGFTVAAPGVLANDSDPDGDPITAVLVDPPTHGTVELEADGSFTYTPPVGFTRTDTFTYIADDGVDRSFPATVTITIP